MLNLTLSNWSLLSARISSQESIVELGPLNVTMKKGAMGDYSVLLFYFTLSSMSKTELCASVKVKGFDKSLYNHI
jgi:hypothetical protein